jgi:flagellar hook-associated protein 2
VIHRGSNMDLSSIVRMQVQIAQRAQASTSTASSELLTPATKRITEQLDSTKVQLSAYGQIKSAVSGVQASASALGTSAISKTATPADVVKAAKAFVDSYNQARQAITTAVTGTGGKVGALASDMRAAKAGNDLANALTGSTSANDLKQAGISLNKDGSLALDTAALTQSLASKPTETKSILTRLSQQEGSSAGKALASTGNVGGSINSLTNRSEKLSSQQAMLQQQAVSAQAMLDQQNSILNYSSANGLAAYKSVLFG